jgi:hypothetical protein
MRTCILLLAMLAASVSAPSFENTREVLAGTRLVLRLVDSVDTEHEPVGQTYRALVYEEVLVAGKLAVEEKSRVLLRLVADKRQEEAVTLDWFAIRFGSEWFEMRLPDGSTGVATSLVSVEDRRPVEAQPKPLVSRGALLYMPSGSVLRFEVKRSVRLVSVGRESY